MRPEGKTDLTTALPANTRRQAGSPWDFRSGLRGERKKKEWAEVLKTKKSTNNKTKHGGNLFRQKKIEKL